MNTSFTSHLRIIRKAVNRKPWTSKLSTDAVPTVIVATKNHKITYLIDAKVDRSKTSQQQFLTHVSLDR